MEERKDWLSAQCAVIGCMLIEPMLAAEILGSTTAADFSGGYQEIYNGCRALFAAGHPVDPVLLLDRLGDGYSKTLLDIMDVTPSAANYRSYLEALRRKSKVARLKQLAQDMLQADSPEALADAVSEANAVMVQRQSYKVTNMEQALSNFFDRQDQQREFLTWPFEGLTDKLYAEAGDYLIIGGYPSSGKSALSLQCAWHWAEKGKRVGFFSLETSAEKLADRQIASVAGISMEKIKRNLLTDAEMASVSRIAGKIAAMPLEYVQAAGMTVSDIKAVAAMRLYDVIIIDYLQLLRTAKPGSRYEMVTQISIDLHTLAQTTGLIVVALAQLARPEKGSNAAPTLSSLRESGQIEQDADVVMMLYKMSQDLNVHTRELAVLKNKEGTLGKLTLDFDGEHQTFRRNWRVPNLKPPEEQDGFQQMIEEEERRYART